MSNEEKKLGEFIIKYRNCDQEKHEDILKVYKNILVDACKDQKIREKLTQLLLYQGHHEFIEQLEAWNIPVFPVHGEMLMSRGVQKGPAFAKILNELKEVWKNKFNFNADANCLLQLVDELVLKFPNKK